MKQMKFKEYEMLRDENMEYLDKREEIRKFVITSTIAILTLAGTEIWEDYQILYFFPIVIIFLSLIRTIAIEQRMKEITAYRIIFLEGKGVNIRWASFITEYDEQFNNKKNYVLNLVGYFDYAILGFLCIAIYAIKFYDDLFVIFQYRMYFNSTFFICMMILFSFIAIIHLSVVRKRIGSDENFRNIKNNWEKLK